MRAIPVSPSATPRRARRGRVVAWSLATVALAGAPLRAQQVPPGSSAPPAALTMVFTSYLAQVGRTNLDLLAQRYALPIADANVVAARVFPDPVLTAGLGSLDVSGVGAPNAVGATLTVPIELPGRNGARVAAAAAQRAVTAAQLEDYLRALRGTAADAYVQALYARLVRDRKARTLASMEALARTIEARVHANEAGEVALLQTHVEEMRVRGELLAAQAAVRGADLALLLQLGARRPLANTPAFEVGGELRQPAHAFDAAALIAGALRDRPDVRAGEAQVRAARARLNLVHANRQLDFAVNLGWQYNLAGATGTAFQAPDYHALGASVTVGLPFSRANHGEVDAATASQGQAEAEQRALELRVEVEIHQALAVYAAAVARVALFSGTLIADAERVLETTLANHPRNAATLLEVLVAQATVDAVYLDYYDALADQAHGLIAVEQAAGIWDVQF